MTSAPADLDWLELADELRAMTDLRSDRRAVEVEHKRASLEKLQTIYSMARAAGDVGKHAISGLLDNNELASMPAVRLTLELGITTQWITATDSGAEALISEFGRQRKNLEKDIAKIHLFAGQQITVSGAGISATTGVEQAGKRFQTRCESLTSGQFLYFLYRLASNYAHATVGIADLYLDLDPGPTGVAFRWEAKPIAPDMWLRLTATSMMWAARALDYLIPKRPHRSRLQQIARELGAPHVLKLTPEARMDERAKLRAPKITKTSPQP